MLDDFFIRALIAGVGIALVAGPLGCFVVWRRLAYFGDTLAHAALLGVALALLLETNITLSVFVVSILVSTCLLWLQQRASLSSDALLGLLSHSALAIGLVVLAFMNWVRVDLMALLFGDILAVSITDIALIYSGGAVVLIALAMIWQKLLAATVDTELAEAEGMSPHGANIAFTLLLALVIAIALKIVGILLITALLIIPAATARQLASSPEQMAIISAIAGVIAAVAGLFGSLEWNSPSGPSIIVAALGLFTLSMLRTANVFQKQKPRSADQQGKIGIDHVN